MPANQNRGLTLRYSVLVGAYWMGFACINGFASLYLLDAGMSNTAIGIMVAVTGIAASFLQPVIAAWADKASSPALGKLCGFFGIIMLLIEAVLLLLRGPSPVLCCGMYGVSLVGLLCLQPLTNAIGMETQNRGLRLNYGAARSCGSVSYAVVAYALGLLAVSLGAVAIPVTTIACFLIYTVCCLLYPLGKGSTTSVSDERKQSDSAAAFFKRYPRYGIMLIGCVLMYASHLMLNNYALQVVTAYGGSSAEMGVGTAIAAVIELAPMLTFVFLIKRFRSDIMVIISGFFFMLKSLATLLANSIPAYYAAQLFQIAGYGLMAVVLVYYVNRLMKPQDVVKGQAWATTANTLGLAIGALAGGSLLDLGGAKLMLLCSTVAAGVGAVIIALGAEKMPVKA